MAPISFARGAPTPECLDPALVADCARAALERDGKTILSYGLGGGYGPLRETLAARHGVDPGRVFLTTGGLQGFVFYAAAQLALRPGRVLVEAPTYDRIVFPSRSRAARAQSATSAGSRHSGVGAPRANEIGATPPAYRRGPTRTPVLAVQGLQLLR